MTPASGSKRRITLEREIPASLETVWALWTTPAGMESWWGPEGFSTVVRHLAARAGGEFEYELAVVDPARRAGMEESGLPLTSVTRGRYLEVVPMERISYVTIIDFVPGVEPYEAATEVEFRAVGDRVKVRLVTDALHDATWTRLARAGFVSQFDRLIRRLEGSPRRG